MSAGPTGFIPASDAANRIATDLALHQECTEVERIILVQSSYGFLSATITSTLMTSNDFYAALTVTNVNLVNNTMTIPGLAAELTSSCMSCPPNLQGVPVTFSSTNLLPAPLTTSTTYYLVPTTTADVYQIALSKQNAFQCPPVIITLSATPSVVTGTTSITSNITGTNSVMGPIGVGGTLVIDGTSLTIPTTDTLEQIAAAINAASIPNVVATVTYTYKYCNNNNGGCCCNQNNVHRYYNYENYSEWNNGNPNYNCNHNNCNKCECHKNNNINNNSVITSAKLSLADTMGAAITIGAGSTAALLTTLGLTAGTFGEIGAAGDLIIDGVTTVINSTDTLTTIVSDINLAMAAASNTNVTASIATNGASLVITDISGAAITIAGTSGVLTALGLTAGTQQASVISATPETQSQLYFNAWQNVYFFPEQQAYVNLMQDVMSYFTSQGYNITRQQQTDSNGNPLPVMQWYITWTY